MIGIVIIVTGVFFVKNMVNSFEESDDILKSLLEKYGQIDDYCPSPSGTIKPERIETFLEARKSLKPIIDELEESIDFLSEESRKREDQERESTGPFKKVLTGIGLIPKIADFLKERNLALLREEMSIGEYYYIYTIAYYCWLNKPITDGVPININEDNEFDYPHWEDEESKEIRHDLAVRRLHNIFLSMLKNQYEKLMESQKSPDISQDWRDALENEIKAMESNRYRLVWQDGLPFLPFGLTKTAWSQVTAPLLTT